jgi:hypothetical protein
MFCALFRFNLIFETTDYYWDYLRQPGLIGKFNLPIPATLADWSDPLLGRQVPRSTLTARWGPAVFQKAVELSPGAGWSRQGGPVLPISPLLL